MKDKIMTPCNPKWNEFVKRLTKKVNFRDVNGKTTWNCNATSKMPLSCAILKAMNMDIKSSKEFFNENGAGCDCEILFNIAHDKGKLIPPPEKFKDEMFTKRISSADKKDIEKKLINFFKKNPYPEDEKVHEFANKLNVKVPDLEEIIYGMLTNELKK